jgi:5-methylcytosine-specific restriction endonuclease McrA
MILKGLTLNLTYFLINFFAVGKPYKKGNCERCGAYGYVNDHHIVPKRVKKNNNKETIRLCLNCHQQLHETLPEEAQSEDFYKDFTLKWIVGIILLLIVIGGILFKTNLI